MPFGFMPVVIDLRPSVNLAVQEPTALAQAFQGPQKLGSDTRRVVPLYHGELGKRSSI